MGTTTAGSDATADPLRAALLDSRRRWRDLVMLTADLAFETDAWGRFVFVTPDPALGWDAGLLLGTAASKLLTPGGEAETRWDPFRTVVPARGRRVWLRRGDGSAACLSFCAAPLLDEEGRIVGAHGVAQDVTVQDGWDATAAAALRRGQVMDHIMYRMRQEVMAPRMMQATLDALGDALGAEGLAVVSVIGAGPAPEPLHQSGAPTLVLAMPTALQMLERSDRTGVTPTGRPVMICPHRTRFGEDVALLLWRAPGGRAWDSDDAALAASSTTLIQVILEHDSIQREMARQARTDPLTGLLNRRAFLEDLGRRVDRLDREGLPGSLMFVDLDHFKQLNDLQGHDAGDTALCLVATLLRDTVRPSDLVARLGGDEFALWLDGADELTAAERAESLRLQTPLVLAHLTSADPHRCGVPLGMSIGIASRRPGHGEDIAALMRRADAVLYEVKRGGRGRWKVSQPGPL